MSTMLERRYRRQHLNCVRHITLDPKGRGVVRIHMIPPREDAENAPFLLLLNGSKLVPLNLSWAVWRMNWGDLLTFGCMIRLRQKRCRSWEAAPGQWRWQTS